MVGKGILEVEGPAFACIRVLYTGKAFFLHLQGSQLEGIMVGSAQFGTIGSPKREPLKGSQEGKYKTNI